jgi:glycosyltransferase involved in cell wall biosynthesis
VTHALVSVADAMTRQALEAGLAPADRFTTVRSGMETDRYQPDAATRERVRREWGVFDDEVVVGTIARLFENKGYEEIIAAMPAALAMAPNLKFVWIGDGAHRGRYRDRLAALGLSERVHFVGLISPSEVPACAGGFDVVLHASRWEGLPRALVQGLLMGAAAVGVDIDGTPEVVIHEETGLLVPHHDPQALARALSRLAGDADLRHRLGRTGAERCKAMFDWQIMVDQLEALYRRLLSVGGGSGKRGHSTF